MATLTRQEVTESGLLATYSAAAGGGDDFKNTGVEWIHVKNGSGGNITVTVVAQNTDASNVPFGDLTKASSVVVVDAATEQFIGPFPTNAFNLVGSVQITYSGVTSLTIAVLTL